jgi:hypothetical protein
MAGAVTFADRPATPRPLLRHVNVTTVQKYAALDSTRSAEVISAIPLQLVAEEAVV